MPSNAREKVTGNKCLRNKNLKPSAIGLPVSHPLPAKAPGTSGVTAEGLSQYMPKRLTETDKWKDSWFLDLSVEAKVFFQYLCDNCDMAGFYQRHDRTISALTGITVASIPNIVDQISKSVFLREGVFWMVNFLEHQKNMPLNPKNNAHLSAIRSLVRHGIFFSDMYLEFLGSSLEDLKILLGADEGLTSPIGKGKGKGKGKALVISSKKKKYVETPTRNHSNQEVDSYPPEVRSMVLGVIGKLKR